MKETPDGENSCVLACAEGTGESFSRLVDGRVPSFCFRESFLSKNPNLRNFSYVVPAYPVL